MKIFSPELYHDYDLNVGQSKVNQFNFKFLVRNVFLVQFQIELADLHLPPSLQLMTVEKQLKIY